MNILITGGASGLGEAITKRLAREDDNTVSFTYNRAKESASAIKQEFPYVIPLKCDFTQNADVLTLREKMKEWDIDVLINNAYSGSYIKTHFNKLDDSDFGSGFHRNILPVMQITQTAINIFRKKKKGKIITVLSSSLLNIPPVGASVYVAEKAYLASMVKSWANENIRYNITSNSVSPSMMLTAMIKELDERLVENVIANHPFKKLITVEEVADTIHFLVHASSHINGVDIVMNAGENLK